MEVKSVAESSKGSILQYLRPSLSYHLSLRPLFCLFLSVHFTQVLMNSHYKGHIQQDKAETDINVCHSYC